MSIGPRSERQQPKIPKSWNAAKNDYVVLTYDLDLGAILAATQGNKPSVVQLRMKDISVEAAGQKIVAALAQTESDLTQGALLTIDEHRTRIRLLPIKRDVGHTQ